MLTTCFSFLIFNSASAQVTANFSASTPISGCSPLCVSFVDQSTGSPTSWSWNFGDPASGPNNVSVLASPSHCYFLSGLYTVTLTVSNGANTDTKVITNYINVYNPPKAHFTVTDTACIGQVLIFADSTTIAPTGSPITNWAWNFGDGNSTTSTNDTVTHFYTTAGNYPVSMIVTDANGCTGNITQNILVVPKPIVSFSATPTSACAPPLNVTFTNISNTVGTTTYFWNFGDGNTSTLANPTNNYTSAGVYTVTLIVNQNGCIDSLVKTTYIQIQKIVAAFTAIPASVCTGDTIAFTNTSVPSVVSATWNFGDAGTSTLVNPIHIYSTAGTFIVTMIATDGSGCIDTTAGTVIVNQTPTANFIADTMVSCSVPFTVTYTNTSTGGTNYSWNFGDNGTSTLTNPVHTYTAAGTYTVTMIAVNSAGGCSDTVVKNSFIIISLPIAGFIHFPDSGCVPHTVNFIDTSSSLVDPITTHLWVFGDGSPNSALQNPVHTYTATGIYSVTLTITTSNGCTATMICPNCIKVGTPPVAKFDAVPDTICYGFPIQFNDSSIPPVTGWLWNFGDGQFSNMQNPQHVYGDTGTYAVYVIAFNNGCADTSLIDSVTVLPPKAIFSYLLSCVNYYTVQFNSTSEGADSLFWDFGDGAQDSSNIINPVHTYPSRGPFTVSLTAFNFATGCSNTTTATFTIAEPIASFSVTNTNGCYPFTVTFTDTSQDMNSFIWNFGDTTTTLDTSTISSNPSYTYNYTSQYAASLIITDVNGCKDTATYIMGALGPYPYFFADTLTGCRPFVVTFADTSVSDSALVQWTWDFGDGSPLFVSTLNSVIHTYTANGVFSVTMTVKDTNGCVKTITKSSYIEVTYPLPAFTYNHFSCKGTTINFDASATNTSTGSTYIWNFGDGTIDTIPTIATDTHAYVNDSLYIISLTVIDKNGCDSTISDTLLILQPTANFSWVLTSINCGLAQYGFLDLSSGYVTNWNWDFGNGGSANVQAPPPDTVFAVYSLGGVYSVQLIVTNLGGCVDTLTLDSIISVPFAVGTFSFSPIAGCNPLTVCYHSGSTNSDQYTWYFGDGSSLITTADSVCHTYLSPGSYYPLLFMQYTLPTTPPTTCSDTASNSTGNVNVTNIINVSLSGPTGITVPEDSIIIVNANYSGGLAPYTYSWTPNIGIDCDTCTTVYIMGTGDTILYTFVIYDASGCVGIDSILVYSEPCFEEKLIPNVFSPNGDGYNDEFYIPGVCPGDKYSLQIYDRWGVLMFSTTLRNNGWDGRNNSGKEAKKGTYYFVVTLGELKDRNNNPLEDEVHKGFVTLVR